LTYRISFAIFALVSQLALIRLILQPVPGHFRVFTGAARALLNGQNPYGTDFGTGVGYFFYSPTCALTVFGPLALLPEKAGLVVYMTISWLVFVLGVRSFWRAFVGEDRTGLTWFWVAISPQIFGGILASKLEILMVGMLLLAVAWLRDGRRVAGACALMALTLNWKFQPLPWAGLVCLSWVILLWQKGRGLAMPALLGSTMAMLYALPFVFFPFALLSQAHTVWQQTFSHFVSEAFLDFENIFAFANHALNVPVDFQTSQLVSAIVGAILAGGIAFWAWRSKSFSDALLVSTALGVAYMTSFSPLGQNNALILYAPLLLTGFVARSRSSQPRRWGWGLALVFAWMTLPYSDAMPVAMRDVLRHAAIKPLACIGLAMAVTLALTRNFARPSEKA
jgi:hypothetical protein